jgi:hypothetical protein
MIVYDKDYKIFIPSGKHIIRIENEGKNWLTIKQISILEYLKKYSVMGLDCKDEAIFWVHNLENNWENVYSNRTIQPVKNVAFEITGIKNGNYNTEWWNTHTGNVFLIDKSESIDGVIKIKLPDELRSDIAFKIKRFN